MVNILRYKCRRVVADRTIAIDAGMHQVIRFAHGTSRYIICTAIVTGSAIAGNASMAEVGRRAECTDRMTKVAILRCRQMRALFETHRQRTRQEECRMTAFTTPGQATVD